MVSKQEKTRGRPVTPGPRYDCGRRKPESNPRGQVILQRIHHAAARIADPILSTPLGVLVVAGELTDRQAEAAFLVQESYAEVDRLQGWKRSARSAALERSSPGEEDEAQIDREAKRSRRARQRFEKIIECFEVLPIAQVGRVRALVERLCVEQQPVTSAQLEDIAPMLDYIGQVFNLAGAAPRPSIAITARRPSRRQPARQDRRPNLQEAAFKDTLRQMQPELSEAEANAKWFEYQGRVERERIRRGKVRR